MKKSFEIEYFVDSNGNCQFNDWINNLDSTPYARIQARLKRIERDGNFGDFKKLSGGINELKFDFGPGYRVYYGINKNKVICILGGDKKSQNRDIKLAVKIWCKE